MGNKTGNYAAFYVSSPFNESNLGAYSTKDFVYYNMLRAWKGKDSSFPFVDSHNKNYNVRDGSDWEKTLKPRLRDRLNHSKNIILFLSSETKSSNALREEIDYGINTCELPVIIVYPNYTDKKDIINCNSNNITKKIQDLWNKLPILRDSMNKVPTLHIPNNKALITSALNDADFKLNTKCAVNKYFYKC